MHIAVKAERALRPCIADGVPRAGGLGDTGKGHPLLGNVLRCLLLETEVRPSNPDAYPTRPMRSAALRTFYLCLAANAERRLGLCLEPFVADTFMAVLTGSVPSGLEFMERRDNPLYRLALSVAEHLLQLFGSSDERLIHENTATGRVALLCDPG